MFFKKLCLLLLLSAPMLSASPLAAPLAAARPEPSESCSGVTGLCWPILRLGSRGEKVRTLQILLKSRGVRVAPDGSFGSTTQSAVRTLQRQKHLRVDGLVGEQTWSQLVPDLARGARGESVRRLQVLLNESDKKWNRGRRQVKVDGFYGSQTREAVRRINVEMSFEPIKGSGQADEAVWCALLGGHFDGE